MELNCITFVTYKNKINYDMKNLNTIKIFIAFATLFIMSAASYAQEGFNFGVNIQPASSSGGEMDFGLIYPSGSSYYTFDKVFTLKMNIGADFGYNFDESLGVSSGLQYARSGQNYANFTDSYNNTISFYTSLSYLRIPFLVHYVLNPDDQTTFSFQTGFYLGFLLSYNVDETIKLNDGSTLEGLATGNSFTTSYSAGTTDNNSFVNGKPFKSVDLGMMIGLGIQYKISNKIAMPILLNYQYGFTDIKNQTSQYSQSSSSNTELFWGKNSPNLTTPYHNSSLGIIIGLKYSL